MRKYQKIITIGILALSVLLVILFAIPSLRSRVVYFSREWYGDIKYALFPPSRVMYQPGEENNPGFVATSVAATLSAARQTQEAVSIPTSSTLGSTIQPTSTSAPLPDYVYLEGVIPEPQLWNNCGPATLSMNLSYYNWGKDQEDAAAVLKPNDRDKNVMPYEMVDFVNDYTHVRAISRMGGDLQVLKSLVSAGFPVLIEKGFEPENLKSEGWMGHFNLVIGYDDDREVFITHDSYLLRHQEDNDSLPGFDVTYSEMLKNWRAFNKVFIVVYPPEKVNDMLNALGKYGDEKQALHIAYAHALEETTLLSNPRDIFFAWFNAGTSLVYLQDYLGAAQAYDKAFLIFNTLDEISKPYRMLWYQTGPYFAYYYSGRYQDVITYTSTTLKEMIEPILEESYYWRAMAELALDDQKAAVKDLRESLKQHPGFIPSMTLMQNLGEKP